VGSNRDQQQQKMEKNWQHLLDASLGNH